MSKIVYKLSELAQAIGASLQGDADCSINNIASIVHAKPGDISYLADEKYQKHLAETQASAILLDPKLAKDYANNALVMPNPKLGFVKLLQLLRPQKMPAVGIHPTAIIGEDCQIDPTVSIGPYVVIGDRVCIGARTVIGPSTMIEEGVSIGEDSYLYSRVSLYHDVVIGDRVILHSGVVIGADGFGLAQDKGQWVKVPQIGRVVMGNDVEIGANTTIDRGALEDTVIGNGVKIDNLVMIGHNVRIGDHTAIAACAGIAGSTTVGKHCLIGASAGLNGHITICDQVIITGMGMIQKSITEPGAYSSGTGMQTNREWHKSVIRFWQLDEIYKRLKRLERLENERHGN